MNTSDFCHHGLGSIDFCINSSDFRHCFSKTFDFYFLIFAISIVVVSFFASILLFKVILLLRIVKRFEFSIDLFQVICCSLHSMILNVPLMILFIPGHIHMSVQVINND